jgi:thioredoxin 1
MKRNAAFGLFYEVATFQYLTESSPSVKKLDRLERMLYVMTLMIEDIFLGGLYMDDKEVLAQVSDSNFEEDVIKSDKPTLIDFWAPWCGPCRMLAPIVEEFAVKNKDLVKVMKLNVDDNPNTSATYGVRSIPTLILFKDGQVKDTMIGLVSKERLDEFVKKNI